MANDLPEQGKSGFVVAKEWVEEHPQVAIGGLIAALASAGLISAAVVKKILDNKQAAAK